MADILEPTPERLAEFEAWMEGRPPAIIELARKFPPWKLYRLKSSGPRVTIISYTEGENGEGLGFQVYVSGQYNRVLFSRAVFGVACGELEECDLPKADEDLGDTSAEAGYSEKDILTVLIPYLKSQGIFKDCAQEQCDGGAAKPV